MLATVGGISMPVTLDTGAEVSVLQREADCVLKMTGEKVNLTGVFEDQTPITAQLTETKLTIGGEVVTTIPALVLGEYISWEGVLAFKKDCWTRSTG